MTDCSCPHKRTHPEFCYSLSAFWSRQNPFPRKKTSRIFFFFFLESFYKISFRGLKDIMQRSHELRGELWVLLSKMKGVHLQKSAALDVIRVLRNHQLTDVSGPRGSKHIAHQRKLSQWEGNRKCLVFLHINATLHSLWHTDTQGWRWPDSDLKSRWSAAWPGLWKKN